MTNTLPQTVAVVRGGPSSEHEVSVKTGATMLELLSEEFEVIDIWISREGTWFVDGKETDSEEAISGIDVVVNGLHGEYGESGEFQQWLEDHGVPFTGSGSAASALAMDKLRSQEVLHNFGVKVPQTRHINREEWRKEDFAEDVFASLNADFLVVKPADLGSSVGVSIVQTEEELKRAIEEVFNLSEHVLIQEYVSGVEATCGVIEHTDGRVEALPVVEIRPPEDMFFDYEAKYNGISQEIVPARFTEEVSTEIRHQAKFAHKALELAQYSRSDVIVTETGEVYWLEANTLPGLTKQSLFPQELDAAGYSFQEWLVWLVQNAYHGNSSKRRRFTIHMRYRPRVDFMEPLRHTGHLVMANDGREIHGEVTIEAFSKEQAVTHAWHEFLEQLAHVEVRTEEITVLEVVETET